MRYLLGVFIALLITCCAVGAHAKGQMYTPPMHTAAPMHTAHGHHAHGCHHHCHDCHCDCDCPCHHR